MKEEIQSVQVEFEGIFQTADSINSFVLRLKEIEGTKYMQVLVNYVDANLISAYSNDIEIDVPMQHQLTLDMLKSCNVKIDSFIIEAASDAILFSSIYLSNGSKLLCRPADGIALAILSNANMYVEESLFNHYGFDENENKILKNNKKESKKEKIRISESQIDELYRSKNYIEAEKTKDEFIKQLNEDLNIYVEDENYEKAAEIRDKISAYQKVDFLKT